jgi:hypothetical protein
VVLLIFFRTLSTYDAEHDSDDLCPTLPLEAHHACALTSPAPIQIPTNPPPLSAKALGPFVRGRNCFEAPVLGPSCADDGFSAYVLFRDHIVRRDPWTIYEVNLQTEAVTPFAG